MAIVIDRPSLGTKAGDTITSCTITTTNAVAAGGFIVAVGGWFANNVPTPVMSGGGLSWTVDKIGSSGNDLAFIASAQAPSGLASSSSISYTLSGGASASALTLGALSFTGVASSSPVDGTALGPVGVSTAAWASGSYSILAGSVIVATSWNEGTVASNTTTAPSVEALDFVNGTDFYGQAAEYRIEASAGSYSVAGTWNAAAANVTVAVAYKAAAAGGVTNEAALRTAHTPVTWRT